jgi:hypothetical protein
MATTNLIRPNSNFANTSPLPTDMLLPVFGGEVLAAFEEYNQFLGMVNTKTITSGREMKFPATWKIGSEYHEAGTELLGLDVETKEYVITLDDRPLVSHFEVDDIDMALSHWEVRGELASQTGQELARQLDRKLAILLLLAARTGADSGTNSFPIGGNTYYGAQAEFDETNWGLEQNALQLIEAIGKINEEMDKKDVPHMGRQCVVNVPLFYALRKLGLPHWPGAKANLEIQSLWGRPDTGSAGPRIQDSRTYGQAIDVLGTPVYMSNHVPDVNITTGPAKYRGDFSKTGGVMFQRDAIGALQLLGVTTENFRDVRRQSDFMVAKIMTGGGTLRPYCAYEIAGT